MGAGGHLRVSKRFGFVCAGRNRIKKERKAIVLQEEHDKSAYEDYGMEITFNKTKFFRDIGKVRLNKEKALRCL